MPDHVARFLSLLFLCAGILVARPVAADCPYAPGERCVRIGRPTVYGDFNGDGKVITDGNPVETDDLYVFDECIYQQTPCQGRAEWRWDVPAEAAQGRGKGESKPVRPAQAGRAPANVRRGRRARAEGALITLARDPAGCEQARREQARKMTRARRLDYQQRRQLDDALRLACQSP